MDDPEQTDQGSTATGVDQNHAPPHVPQPRSSGGASELPTTAWFGELQSGFAHLESNIAELESGVADLESGLARIRPEQERAAPITAPIEPDWSLLGFEPFPDVTPPHPVDPSPTSGPRAWRWILLLLVVLAVGVGAWQIVSDRDEEPAAAPRAKAVEPPAPVALPDIGSFVQSTVLADGDILVQHWIRADGIFTLTLSAPELATTSQVRASDVEILADGTELFGRSSIETADRTHYLEGAKAIYVSYLLEGAIERTDSAPGRALARVTALDVSYDAQGGTSTRRIQGADVLSMACYPPTSPGTGVRPCGSDEDGAWQVELDPRNRDDRVMVQFDQP
ncbi:hypothetical protein NOCA270106 [metagenome]|uniref:Uncharacterized protein n=1 Tax=metagenome TaxID=256318 RepID=A0A2P2CDU6_9ZZZZ